MFNIAQIWDIQVSKNIFKSIKPYEMTAFASIRKGKLESALSEVLFK